MILVYLAAESRANWLKEALGSRAWNRLPEIPTKAMTPEDTDVYVLILEELDRQTIERVRRLRAAAPLTPIVVCLRFDRKVASELGAVLFERVVWLEDPPSALDRAMTEVGAVPLRCRLAESILQSGKVRGRVCEALRAILCADGRRPSTAAGLARSIGCSVASLRRAWRDQVLPHSGLHLHDVLQWVVVLEAHERRARGASWMSAADQIGVSYNTLKRAVADAAGLGLDELDNLSEIELNLRFASRLTRLLPTLIGGTEKGRKPPS